MKTVIALLLAMAVILVMVNFVTGTKYEGWDNCMEEANQILDDFGMRLVEPDHPLLERYRIPDHINVLMIRAIVTGEDTSITIHWVPQKDGKVPLTAPIR
jgi:hypothetical protein